MFLIKKRPADFAQFDLDEVEHGQKCNFKLRRINLHIFRQLLYALHMKPQDQHHQVLCRQRWGLKQQHVQHQQGHQQGHEQYTANFHL
jgi:hypothetical protein